MLFIIAIRGQQVDQIESVAGDFCTCLPRPVLLRTEFLDRPQRSPCRIEIGTMLDIELYRLSHMANSIGFYFIFVFQIATKIGKHHLLLVDIFGRQVPQYLNNEIGIVFIFFCYFPAITISRGLFI